MLLSLPYGLFPQEFQSIALLSFSVSFLSANPVQTHLVLYPLNTPKRKFVAFILDSFSSIKLSCIILKHLNT